MRPLSAGVSRRISRVTYHAIMLDPTNEETKNEDHLLIVSPVSNRTKSIADALARNLNEPA